MQAKALSLAGFGLWWRNKTGIPELEYTVDTIIKSFILKYRFSEKNCSPELLYNRIKSLYQNQMAISHFVAAAARSSSQWPAWGGEGRGQP